MKKLKNMMVTAVALLLSATAMAEGFEYEGIHYNTLTDSTAEVADNYNYNLEGRIVIPKYVTFGDRQLEVTAIGRYAFGGQTGITEITIPETVEHIGYNALMNTGIKTITMTHMPKEMEWGVFYGCEQLTEAVMPATMKELPSMTFAECKRLKSVYLPQTLTKICNAAFNGCTALESFTLPDSLKVLEENAFANCTNLTEIELPPSITVIPNACFINCYGLHRIVIPGTVTQIDYEAFENCTSLEEVVWGDGVSIKSLESSVFRNCKNLKQLTIPESVTTIYNNAFEGAGLTSIVLGPNIERLSEYAFKDCSNLNDVYLRASKLTGLSPWGETFSNPTLYFGTLHVPEGEKIKYMHQEVWKDFVNIEEENISGKQYCLVEASCANHQFQINGGDMVNDTYLELEKGQPLTVTIPKEDFWSSINNHRYLSSILVNGEEMLPELVDGQLSFDAVEQDLNIEIRYDLYNVSLAIYQDERGGLEFLTELRGKTDIMVMPAEGNKAQVKWGPWHETYEWEPWYETTDVYGQKTYNLYGNGFNDQEINIKYQKR